MMGFVMMDAASLFDRFFVAGGPIVWFVLLPMSVAMLALGLDLGIRIRRKVLLPAGRAAEIAGLARQYGLDGLPGRLKNHSDFLSRALLRALVKCGRKGMDIELVREAAADGLREEGLGLLRRAEGCHLIGTVAPMVGLFGTVFGMIQAFTLLGSSGGQPQPDQLAEAISVALVTTFWGLLAAIPALFLHGLFRTRIESFVSEAAAETEALLERLVEMGCFRAPVSGFNQTEGRQKRSQESEGRSLREGEHPVAEEEEPIRLEFGADE
jgi:biopolymer transport protein ExbB